MKHARYIDLCVASAAAALFLSAGSPVGASPAARVAPADTVLYDGLIYTVDQRNSVQQAIAVQGGYIVFVGANSAVRSYIGKRTDVIDLHGRMVMPGLIDAHNHPIQGGLQLLECNLNYAPLTIAQFRQSIQDCLDRSKSEEPDTYLQVMGWYRQAMQPSGTQVTHADLDALKTRRPIVVQSSDGHTKLANSRAIQLAAITRDTPDPHAGRIDRGPSGELTGTFEDMAERLVRKPIPPLTPADVLSAAKAALDAFRRQGETAFMMQDAAKPDIEAWSALQKQGLLTARAYMAPDVPAQQMLEDPGPAVQQILDLKRQFDTGPIGPQPNLWVRNSGELFQDGVLQWPAQTASLLQPYLVNKGTKAKPDWAPGPWSGPAPYTPLQPLERVLLALARAGIDPEVHAIGDRAVRHTLDAYAYVRQQLHGRDVRLEIAHAEMVTPQDYGRFRELNVIADMAFQWAKPAYDSIDAGKNFLGPTRFNRMEPEGYLVRAGAWVAQGSDWPVDPLNNWFDMKVLLTREGSLGGKYSGPLGTVPDVPVRAAIRAFTINGAYALHSERYFGSLERGKLADLIVIDRNLLAIPPSQVADTKVLMTMVGGKAVFRAPSF